jgi:glycerol-3-phosphate acyltransferase PlsX
MDAVIGAFATSDETRRAGEVLLPALLPMAEELDPETYGGAVLLGVDGLCMISHGSSSSRAIVNAVRAAAAASSEDLVGRLRTAVCR